LFGPDVNKPFPLFTIVEIPAPFMLYCISIILSKSMDFILRLRFEVFDTMATAQTSPAVIYMNDRSDEGLIKATLTDIQWERIVMTLTMHIEYGEDFDPSIPLDFYLVTAYFKANCKFQATQVDEHTYKLVTNVTNPSYCMCIPTGTYTLVIAHGGRHPRLPGGRGRNSARSSRTSPAPSCTTTAPRATVSTSPAPKQKKTSSRSSRSWTWGVRPSRSLIRRPVPR